MKKSKFGFALSLLAAGSILAACGAGDKAEDSNKDEGKTASEGGDFSVAMVTDTGSVDDKSFNQSAWEGIQAFGKDNGLEKGDGGYDYLESTSDADYNQNLNNLLRRDFDLVFGIGFMMGDAMLEVAEQQPDAQLAIVDAVADAPNVTSILFKEQEGAFLAGVVAAEMSKTGKVGFVGGMENEVIKRFEAGFLAGVEAVNPDIKVDVQYTGDFNKAELGKTSANRMYSSGVDIIFHAAGGAGNGVFTEAKERKEKDPNADVWVIGVDSDQYDEGQVDADTNVTLTSMLKRVDVAVKDVATKTKEGNFPGGTVVYGLAENGVDLADSRGAIPQEVLDTVEDYKTKIINGEVKIPETVK